MSEEQTPRPPRRPLAWLTGWFRRELQREARQWRRSVRNLFIFVVAVLVARVVANVWIGHELDNEVARLEKKYGPIEPIDLPTVAPWENRARVVRAAASLLIVGPYESRILDRFNRASARPSTEELRRVVEVNDLALRVADEAQRRPRSNWEIDYSGGEANFPRLLDLRRLGTVIAAACRGDIDAGRPDQGAQAAVAGVAVADSMRQEPNLIIQLVRMAVANAQFGCVRDLLERGEPSGGALANLAGALADSRAQDSGVGLVGELRMIHHAYQQMEAGDLANTSGASLSPTWAGPLCWLVRPLIRYVHLRGLRTIAALMDDQATPPFQRPPSPPPPRWWQAGRHIDGWFTRGLAMASIRGFEYRAVLNAAQLAVGLRRYRLEHGAYPDALDALVPQYLARIEADPFTGRPPRYARVAAGFDLRLQGAPRSDSALLEWRIAR